MNDFNLSDWYDISTMANDEFIISLPQYDILHWLVENTSHKKHHHARHMHCTYA
ncbi:11325_t:CDS:1, partial [Acaulospora colombiana]